MTDAAYDDGCNPALLRAVPAHARRILDVGCAAGRLGEALKRDRPDRVVHGVERRPGPAARAATRLDAVHAVDIEADDLPIPAGSLDAILLGDVLEHLDRPVDALRRLARLLAPGGVVLASVPNLQHHSLLAALLSGDWQPATAGLLDATHRHFFTASTIRKVFLDAGLEPEPAGVINVPAPPGLLDAVRPLLANLGIDPRRAGPQLDAYQYILRGTPLDAVPEPAYEPPLTVAACVSDRSILEANLLASPCLAPERGHELILLEGAPDAASALNAALDRARHDTIVCVHQDVYLPRDWTRRLRRSWAEAEIFFGPIGVAGVYGARREPGGFRRVGRVVDRDRLLREPAALPAPVETLDELALVLPRGTPLRFDPTLGFHFYGADIALQARVRGLAAVALDAPCLHNSRSVDLPPAFFASARAFAAKWSPRLPVATPCVRVDPGGGLVGY